MSERSDPVFHPSPVHELQALCTKASALTFPKSVDFPRDLHGGIVWISAYGCARSAFGNIVMEAMYAHDLLQHFSFDVCGKQVIAHAKKFCEMMRATFLDIETQGCLVWSILEEPEIIPKIRRLVRDMEGHIILCEHITYV